VKGRWIVLLALAGCLLLMSCSRSEPSEEHAALSSRMAECLSRLDKLDHSIEAIRIAREPAIVIRGVFWEDDDTVVVCNRSQNRIDLSGWVLTDNEGSYAFPEGASINALGEYTVAFSLYNPTDNKRGLWFSEECDQIVLKDRDGNVIDQYQW
jgi:Lamin Tail Domain